MKNFRKQIALLLALCTVFTSITVEPLTAFAAENIREYGGDGYRIICEVVNEWQGGQQVSVTIVNTGTEPIENWGLQADICGTVGNIWNASAQYDAKSGKTVIRNNQYNAQIPVDGQISFGYTQYGDSFCFSKEMILTQQKREVSEGYEICCNITNDWGTGFQGTLTIVNTKEEPIESWRLELRSSVELGSVWGAECAAQEERLVLTACGWNGVIAAGGSVTIGFTGVKDENTEICFSDYVLTEVVIYPKTGSTATPGGTEEPSETPTEKPTEETIEPTDYTLDTDEDGLPDWLEEELGCDAENPDTDGDGLPDGYEVFLLGTNPAKADSDDNGVLDGDEDTDGDGLTDYEEYEIGSNLLNQDTDNDGLEDYEELYVYGTNPLLPDTDEDGIKDGDELLLGLNPALKDTDNDGVLDSEVKNRQEIFYEFTDEPVKKVSVTMECTGYIEATTKIKNMKNIDILSSNVVGLVGSPIDIHTNSRFDKAVITFYFDEEQLGETRPEDLAIMWYDKEEGDYVVLEDSVVDIEKGTVSYVTTHFSTYLLVDTDEWYELWKNAPDYNLSNGNYMDLIIVTDYTLKTDEKDTFEEATEITETLRNNLLLGKEQDRCLIMNYPYDNDNYELTSTKSRILSQYYGMKPTQTQEEIDRIYLLKDGKFNTEYLYEGFSIDNFEHHTSFYGVEYYYNLIKDSGKYLWFSNSTNTGFDEYDGYIGKHGLTGDPRYNAMIQLRQPIENCRKIGFNGRILKYYKGGFLKDCALELLWFQTEDNWLDSKFECASIEKVSADFISSENSIQNLTYGDAIDIEGYFADTDIKDIWIEGYFKESMAEKGLEMALDAFENAEYTGNKRRLVYISAIDTKPIPDEILERAKALDVTIDTMYLGDISSQKKMNMNDLAEHTNGRSYFPRYIDELQSALFYRKPDDLETMSDYDKDGIPDDFEFAGLYLCNGEIVFTNPTKEDTDKDGLTDGQELGIGDGGIRDIMKSMWCMDSNGNFKKKYYFSCVSDPTKADSDEDGYLDCIENTLREENPNKYADEADETPLVSSVEITMLAGAEEGKYVPVVYEGTEYTAEKDGYRRTAANPNYGGNQNWLFDEKAYLESKGVDVIYYDEKNQEYRKTLKSPECVQYIQEMDAITYTEFCYENAGCGITAMLDYMMFLEYYNADMDTYIEDKMAADKDGNSYIPYYTYIREYVDMARKLNFYHIPNIGLNAGGSLGVAVNNMCSVMTNYLYKKGAGVRPVDIYSIPYYDNSEIDSQIKTQLQNNIPVISLSLLILDKKTIYKMYKYNENAFCKHIQQDGNNDDSDGSDGSSFSKEGIYYHYVTITGIIEDLQQEQVYYIVSSWGQRHVVNASQLKKLPTLPERIVSGILYVS